MRAFVRQSRTTSTNVRTLLQAVWIDGRAKSALACTRTVLVRQLEKEKQMSWFLSNPLFLWLQVVVWTVLYPPQ